MALGFCCDEAATRWVKTEVVATATATFRCPAERLVSLWNTALGPAPRDVAALVAGLRSVMHSGQMRVYQPLLSSFEQGALSSAFLSQNKNGERLPIDDALCIETGGLNR